MLGAETFLALGLFFLVIHRIVVSHLKTQTTALNVLNSVAGNIRLITWIAAGFAAAQLVLWMSSEMLIPSLAIYELENLLVALRSFVDRYRPSATTSLILLGILMVLALLPISGRYWRPLPFFLRYSKAVGSIYASLVLITSFSFFGVGAFSGIAQLEARLVEEVEKAQRGLEQELLAAERNFETATQEIKDTLVEHALSELFGILNRCPSEPGGTCRINEFYSKLSFVRGEAASPPAAIDKAIEARLIAIDDAAKAISRRLDLLTESNLYLLKRPQVAGSDWTLTKSIGIIEEIKEFRQGRRENLPPELLSFLKKYIGTVYDKVIGDPVEDLTRMIGLDVPLEILRLILDPVLQEPLKDKINRLLEDMVSRIVRNDYRAQSLREEMAAATATVRQTLVESSQAKALVLDIQSRLPELSRELTAVQSEILFLSSYRRLSDANFGGRNSNVPSEYISELQKRIISIQDIGARLEYSMRAYDSLVRRDVSAMPNEPEIESLLRYRLFEISRDFLPLRAEGDGTPAANFWAIRDRGERERWATEALEKGQLISGLAKLNSELGLDWTTVWPQAQRIHNLVRQEASSEIGKARHAFIVANEGHLLYRAAYWASLTWFLAAAVDGKENGVNWETKFYEFILVSEDLRNLWNRHIESLPHEVREQVEKPNKLAEASVRAAEAKEVERSSQRPNSTSSDFSKHPYVPPRGR